MQYFEQYGKVQDCVLIKDKETGFLTFLQEFSYYLGKSRGFGFITFEDEQVTDDVVSKTHIIEGREVIEIVLECLYKQVTCKKASSSSHSAEPKEVIAKTNRIKIANLSLITTDGKKATCEWGKK